ncbi:MAG: hypothetical protein K6T16_02160, partial [Candidatus Pacearchaeota archaeon]|nr:hypothetical protein [Candidatus Pacearchaeota archaeon]
MAADANTNQGILNKIKRILLIISFCSMIAPKNEFVTVKENPKDLLQHTFVGWLRRAANNVPTDSATVKFVNPVGDTIVTKVGRIMQDYYSKT